MRFLKIITSFTIVAFLFFLSPKLAKASDGTVELRSVTQENYHCFVASMFIDNYKILVGCKDLVYPKGPRVMSYVLWATPVEGDKPIKLGTLDFGRKFFQIKNAFSNLYVTLEENPNVRSPAGAVVMRGNIKPITFLEEPVTPAPAEAEATESEKAEEQKQTTTREKLLTALKRAGVAALFALVALVGLIFVITRSRR